MAEKARKVFDELSEEAAQTYAPSIKVLFVFHTLLDLYEQQGKSENLNDVSKAIITVVGRIQTGMKNSRNVAAATVSAPSFLLAAYESFAEFYVFYDEYRCLKQRAAREMEANSRLEEKLAAKKKADPDEEESALDVGDVIPHLTELSLEKQGR